MRIFAVIVSILLVVSCSSEKKTDIKKPTWLIGKWIRTNDKPNHTTYETWYSDFSGYGLTLKEKDTTFFEKMELLVKNDTLVLEVSGVNEKPTPFKFSKQTDTSFLAENPQNEFPKKIKYWLDGETLRAKVWNEGDYTVDFSFVKTK